MEKTYKKIEELREWDKNPRSISKENFERLKRQITKLGQYKPLLITNDGTVLGGNMRLKAYRDLGIKDIWVSIVDAPTEEKKIEYALSDNLIGNFPNVDYGDFAVEIKPPIDIETLQKNLGIDFENIESTEDREKMFKKQLITCPHCEKSFEITI